MSFPAGPPTGGLPSAAPAGAIVPVHTDQQMYRELARNRAQSGDSSNPAKELAAVQAQISFCLRKLQTYVVSGKVEVANLKRWSQRQRIAGSVSIWDDLVITKQGRRVRIRSACMAAAGDGECPRFEPCDKTVGEEAAPASFEAEVRRCTRWSIAVLSELLSTLEMELARVGWTAEEFGPIDFAHRDAAERLRTTTADATSAPSTPSPRVVK